MDKIITPSLIIKRLKERREKLLAQGIEPTIDNLNAYAIREFRMKLKEQNNG